MRIEQPLKTRLRRADRIFCQQLSYASSTDRPDQDFECRDTVRPRPGGRVACRMTVTRVILRLSQGIGPVRNTASQCRKILETDLIFLTSEGMRLMQALATVPS